MDNPPQIDATRYITAFAVPVVIVLFTAVVRKATRRRDGFRPDDFFLGIDLTLAAFSAALVNVLDLTASSPTHKNVAILAVWFIVACFGLFLLQLSFHQDWASENKDSKVNFTSKKQILFLGVASNLIGIGLLGWFMVLKLKEKI